MSKTNLKEQEINQDYSNFVPAGTKYVEGYFVRVTFREGSVNGLLSVETLQGNLVDIAINEYAYLEVKPLCVASGDSKLEEAPAYKIHLKDTVTNDGVKRVSYAGNRRLPSARRRRELLEVKEE